jgi:transcriptional regulator with XRE-family HTH domain
MRLEPQNIRKILSKNIKNRRKVLGFSQEKLAEITDLSSQTINDIEGCRMWVSDKTISKLCQALQIEAYQLLLPHLLEPEKGYAVPSPSDILLTLQQNIKKNIDLQFEEILKSGTF